VTNVASELIELSPEQREIRDVCHDFAEREIRPVSREVDEADIEMPWEIWRKASELGITTFMLPEELGGGGLTDVLTQCIVQEELCWGCSGIGNLICSNGFFAEPLLELGTEEQQRRWLEPLVTDSSLLGALASTEPGVGSDAASMTTTATRADGGYRLRGQKAWVSNGGIATYYVVFATVEPGTRHRGITAFLVEKGDEGVSFGQPMRKMGQRAIVNSELFLGDAFLPDDRRLGDEGQGFYGLMGTFDRSRVILGAAATGLARAATEYAVEYAKSREQFGKPIAEHQAVAFRLADMALRVDASRLLVLRAARKLDAGEPAPLEAAMAKLHASETAMFCTWACVQTLGGWGYSREYLAEKWMRDAKLEEIEEGTSDIQRLIISRQLLKDG
jgi:alkylation response protein AidB-like acyl-CoA dehydrogenase